GEGPRQPEPGADVDIENTAPISIRDLVPIRAWEDRRVVHQDVNLTCRAPDLRQHGLKFASPQAHVEWRGDEPGIALVATGQRGERLRLQICGDDRGTAIEQGLHYALSKATGGASHQRPPPAQIHDHINHLLPSSPDW